MAKFAESHVEEAAMEWLPEQGWQVAYGIDASPDGKVPERASNRDVILMQRLVDAVDRLNPAISQRAPIQFASWWRSKCPHWLKRAGGCTG